MSDVWKSYWPILERLEGELCELTFGVAFADSHLGVHSSRLSDLLLRTCAECENIGKSVCIDKALATAATVHNFNFPDIGDTICSGIPIHTKEPIIIWPYQSLTTTSIRPFDTWLPTGGSTNPDWFKAYNKIKHDRIANAQKANIKNVIHALGGLFILNLWLRDEDITQHSEHFNLAKNRVSSYSRFFSPENFLKTTEGNLRNLVFDWT